MTTTYVTNIALVGLAFSAGVGLTPHPATAQSALDVLAGSWRGSGTMLFEDGTAEAMNCNGYYRAGANMSVVIRCKGSDSKFELRSKLLKSEGDKVSGVWEERTYNASGQASGTALPGKLNVQFSGSLAGRLELSFSPSSQSVSVSIDTEGTGLKGARVSFSRL
jgi:hypothetical protein